MSEQGTPEEQLVSRYLARLRRASRGLPRVHREELLADIRGHLQEAVESGETEIELRTEIERLGEPEQLVRERLGVVARVAGLREWITVVALAIGGIVIPIVGWFIGVLLLWTSRVWTVRDKLIGTLILPGGYAGLLYLGVFASGGGSFGGVLCSTTRVRGHVVHRCVGAPPAAGPNALGIALLVIALAAPLVTMAYLIIVVRRRPLRPA